MTDWAVCGGLTSGSGSAAHARLTEAVDRRLAEAGCVALGTFDVLAAGQEALAQMSARGGPSPGRLGLQ